MPTPSNPAGRPRTALVLGALLLLAGCGYRLAQARGIGAAAGARAVVAGSIENLTAEADAGLLVAQALQRGLAMRVAGTEAPALTVPAVLERVSFVPVGFGANGRPNTWRATVKLRLTLVDGARPIANATAEANVDTPAGADVESTEVARRLVLHRAVEQAVDGALDRLSR